MLVISTSPKEILFIELVLAGYEIHLLFLDKFYSRFLECKSTIVWFAFACLVRVDGVSGYQIGFQLFAVA